MEEARYTAIQCAIKTASKYVDLANKGANTDERLLEVLEMNAYVDVLCRYETEPAEKEVNKSIILTNNSIPLYNDGKMLYLDVCSKECIEPENCLTEDEFCKIWERIKTKSC